MTTLNQCLTLSMYLFFLVLINGCDSQPTLSSSQNLQNQSEVAEGFQVPSLAFGKSDQTQTAELKSALKFSQSYPDVAEKAHVFPLTLQKGDRIRVYTWTDQLAMILMFGSETQDRIWKDEEWRQATQNVKPGLAKQDVEFEAKQDGRHVVVVAPYGQATEYLLNVQCVSGSCLKSEELNQD